MLTLNCAYTESQPLSSRWRALAHSHARSINLHHDERVKKNISKNLLNMFSAVHVLVGRSAYADVELHEEFATEISDIAETTVKLSCMIKEKIMSTNYDIRFKMPGHKFDAAVTDDYFEGASSGEILCTVEIGLQMQTGGKDSRERSASAGKSIDILLKPKVVTYDSALRYLADS